ncbi:S26 family signal peptidase [Streptomyces sp. Je 1-4]|uniref:S26 family signal peptidase n=1 Tax=Streptomyces TaxID=1883 RepID=UPI00140F297C|nr:MULTISPECIES: S26 family signal peptidase [unclassified Streptomyces]QIK04877.1 S26 family signal peptidase [Streptomyces sp. ID38640]UYB38037.1 S26 family signal peptidase [Streptomyces sp. Je 1-4]UZQ33972.1 S26 family signal peptidase [Streptomyces sp. Je 1-4] [Streptomyces sp. Je 1-4 4N24]UZQ41390.1 S26 family signal peptidase [Streptomyces sp. Je 1-4] [Streptomyces sp. Je 1-4 4N24_ara]
MSAATAAVLLGLTGLLPAAAILLSHRLVLVTVRGVSMAPAYRDGDRVLVRRTARPTRGQVLVVERPALHTRWPSGPLPAGAGARAVGQRQWLIKRLAALPGDPVPEAMLSASPLARPNPPRVPAGSLVLLGDNPQHSVDSRQFGFYPAERVLGTVVGPLKPARARRPLRSARERRLLRSARTHRPFRSARTRRLRPPAV